MSNTLKIKRGTEAGMPTLAAGEPGWATDTHDLFVGDGSENFKVGNLKMPSDENLIGYWPLDEGVGTTTIDGSNNGADGTLINTPTWVQGVSGKALQLDNSNNEYVEIDYNDLPNLDISDKWSISLWYSPSSGSTHPMPRLFQMRDGDAHKFSVVCVAQTTTPLFCMNYYIGGSVYPKRANGPTLSYDTWYHCVFTFDNETVKCYVNGVEYSTEDAGASSQAGTYGIGVYGGSIAGAHGRIDEVRLYTSVLTKEEAKALYLNPGGNAILTPTHNSLHVAGAADEIDGDKLDIDWNPSNYTPATTPSEVDSVDHLTAHLYGIDQALAGAGGSHASDHITGGADEIDGDKLEIDWNPSNYTPATTPSEADSVDNLTAHLYGIDQALGSRVQMKTGTYTGDGTDDRNINIGVDLASATYKWLEIKPEEASYAAQKFGHETGDASDWFHARAQESNAIQAWTSTGFQIGSHAYVNTNGQTYNWVVFWQD